MLLEEILIDTETNQIHESMNTYNDSEQLVSTVSPGEYGNTMVKLTNIELIVGLIRYFLLLLSAKRFVPRK